MDLHEMRNEIIRVAARHGARNVRLFGSVARGEDHPGSDLDLLVEMDADRSLLDLVRTGCMKFASGGQHRHQTTGRDLTLTAGSLKPR